MQHLITFNVFVIVNIFDEELISFVFQAIILVSQGQTSDSGRFYYQSHL
jgi:hypothetical protein